MKLDNNINIIKQPKSWTSMAYKGKSYLGLDQVLFQHTRELVGRVWLWICRRPALGQRLVVVRVWESEVDHALVGAGGGGSGGGESGGIGRRRSRNDGSGCRVLFWLLCAGCFHYLRCRRVRGHKFWNNGRISTVIQAILNLLLKKRMYTRSLQLLLAKLFPLPCIIKCVL